jgi:hypothetical protein
MVLNFLPSLMKIGMQKILEAKDCGATTNVDHSEYASSKEQAAWKKDIIAMEAANVLNY